MIVLDTHALVWWASTDQRLSRPARQAIESELASGASLLVSAITCWEIAALVARGRLALSCDLDTWLDALESLECLEFVPIGSRLTVQSTRLPGSFHKDPADRFIVALARERGATLITADEQIQRYPHVKWLW